MNNSMENYDGTYYNVFLASLGTMRPFFEEINVTNIALNPSGEIWVKKGGLEGWVNTGSVMERQSARKLCELVAGFSQTTVSAQSPNLSAELPFLGYRFESNDYNVTKFPAITIRKPSLKVFSLDEYVGQGVITKEAQSAILKAVATKQNILCIGGTDSGKTTFINAILNEFKDTNERILTIEDTRELRCPAKNVVQMKTTDYMDATACLKSAMRQTPDRILIGEVRDKVALDLIKAWNTGHPGGCSTIHANSCYGGFTRLEQLIEEAGVKAVPEVLAETINLLIFINTPYGIRKVREMAYCTGYDKQKKEYKLEYIIKENLQGQE